jgi:hypothetical protein
VEAALKRTADANAGYGNTSLLEVALATLTGPLAPTVLALDAWWQNSRTNQVLGQLTGIRRLGQEWINNMQDAWLPGFMERIDKVDRSLGDRVSAQFDLVGVQMNRVTALLKDTSELPLYVFTSAVGKFWGGLKKDLVAIVTSLYKILDAMGRLFREAGGALAAFPTLVVVAGVAALIYAVTR